MIRQETYYSTYKKMCIESIAELTEAIAQHASDNPSPDWGACGDLMHVKNLLVQATDYLFVKHEVSQ